MKKLLLICFDFGDWTNARSWSYVSSYLIYHQLSTCPGWDVELQIVPYTYSERKVDELIEVIAKNRNFDLILTWLPHLNLSKRAISTLYGASKNLIFLLIESLCYTADEIAELPHLRHRWKQVTSIITKEYPVICLCPRSFRKLKSYGFRAALVYGFWPTNYNIDFPKFKTLKTFAFAASIYNNTRREASEIVTKLFSKNGYNRIEIIDSSIYVNEFNQLCKDLVIADQELQDKKTGFRGEICERIAEVRKRIWLDFMTQLANAEVLVTLPSYFKGIPGRVIESLYCGIPVIFFESNIDSEDINKVSSFDGISFEKRYSFENAIQKEIVSPDKDIGSILFRDSGEFLNDCTLFPDKYFSSAKRPLLNGNVFLNKIYELYGKLRWNLRNY
jgi:hypothetical protein